LVLDPKDGALDFAYPFRSRTYESVNAASPVIAGERVFLTASYNTGTAALELTEDGSYEELWKTVRFGLQFSNPVFVDGYLYAVDGRSDRAGAVVCIDPATGEEAARTDLYWEEQVVYGGEEKTISFSIGEGSLLAVEGGFLCLGDNGHLLSLKAGPEGAEVVSRASLFRANESWTPLVLSRGLLYVCQNNRERFGAEPRPARLLCYDLRAGE
jgi:outer membrane protein assembly factor BamB